MHMPWHICAQKEEEEKEEERKEEGEEEGRRRRGDQETKRAGKMAELVKCLPHSMRVQVQISEPVSRRQKWPSVPDSPVLVAGDSRGRAH